MTPPSAIVTGKVPELQEWSFLPATPNSFAMVTRNQDKFLADLINSVYLPGGLKDQLQEAVGLLRDIVCHNRNVYDAHKEWQALDNAKQFLSRYDGQDGEGVV